MIGDWVKSRGKIEQVREVYEGYICTDSFEDSHDYYFDPIPLTPEILEKNGMILSFYGEFFPEDEHYELEISVVGGRIFWTINAHEYDIMCLRFVHELQHALRLCGIEKEIML